MMLKKGTYLADSPTSKAVRAFGLKVCLNGDQDGHRERGTHCMDKTLAELS